MVSNSISSLINSQIAKKDFKSIVNNYKDFFQEIRLVQDFSQSYLFSLIGIFKSIQSLDIDCIDNSIKEIIN